jgi:hypothetical protein
MQQHKGANRRAVIEQYEVLGHIPPVSAHKSIVINGGLKIKTLPLKPIFVDIIAVGTVQRDRRKGKRLVQFRQSLDMVKMTMSE